MKFLDRNAPGVEWSQDSPDTVSMAPPGQSTDVYPTACPACGGELGVDGYCLVCGQKAKNLREHYETAPQPWLAGVCDIGALHTRNEDAMACQADQTRAVIVVCDGVTTSDGSDVASLAAARTACDLLWADDPQGVGTASSRTAAVNAVLTQAVTTANQAVIDATSEDSRNSAATTIAIAVTDDKAIHCANLGDSRVYWLPDAAAPCQITKDHSLAQDGIDSGTGRAEAESSIFAHTITKWLGRDATDVTPYLAVVERDGPGWLLVCSDGLWNYASEAAAVAALVGQFTAADPTPSHLASALVAWANDQGGHDNITVVCARLTAPGAAAADTAAAQGTTPLSTDPEAGERPTVRLG